MSKTEKSMNSEYKTHHALESLELGEALDLEDTLWWVQGRKSIIRRHLKKVTSTMGRIRTIMDVGCGSGGNLDVLAEFGRVIGVEPSSVLAHRAKSRGIASEVYESPAWRLEETGTIDLFTMFDVLEHIEDDGKFLTQLKECASPNHKLLLSVPACPFLFGEHDRLLSHYRRYSRKMLNDCLACAGYETLSMRYYMFFAFPAALVMRLVDQVKRRIGIERKSVNLGTVPPLVNGILGRVLGFESALSEYVRFPTGLWLFAIARPKVE